MRIWIALIEPEQKQSPPSASHFRGLPQELSPCGAAPGLFPRPDFLIIEETNGEFFLFRYTRSKEFSGDTWHQSLQEAREQAVNELGASLLSWRELPSGVEDPISHGARLFAEQRMSGGGA
jgi:hypothetical protein